MAKPFCNKNGVCEPELGENPSCKDCKNVKEEPSEPICGNEVLEQGEECDVSKLNNLNCIDFDYDSGSLGCNSECTFDYSECSITVSSGGNPSGGGGSPISEEKEETIVNVEEKEEKVEETMKASSVEEENPLGGTGSIVKEQEMKPKVSRIKVLFVKIGDFFKFVWYKVVSLFR